MGNLKVKRIEVELMSKKHQILFTVDAIYDIEEVFKKDIADIFKELDIKNKDVCKTVYTIITTLINCSKKKQSDKLNISDVISQATTNQFIYLRYCLIKTINESFFLQKKEDDCDYAEEVKKEHGDINLCERMFTVGHEMGYHDEEIWRMTPRQLLCLYEDLGKFKSGDKPKRTIDDIL